MSTPRSCLICTAPSYYAHYGIEACRSCADFYKRTVDANRKYQCRKGDRQCAINPKDRHNCRGCRFAKCKTLGMKFDSDLIPTVPSESTKEPLLALIRKEHALSIARRKACELKMHSSLHRRVRADIEGEMCTGDYLRFAAACFPEFAALSSADQASVFSLNIQLHLLVTSFAVRLFNAEILCDTFKRFGTLDGDFAMATINTCYDIRKFEFVTEQESPAMNKAITKSLLHYQHRIRRLVGPILNQSLFTDTEMASIFALSVWWIDPDQSLPEHIISLTRRVRLRIFEAMKEYYKQELSMDNYSELPHILVESMQLLNVAGMLTEDSPFLEEFMKMSL